MASVIKVSEILHPTENVPSLTAAIQELKSIIDQQDARIKTLEGNV